MALKHSLVSDQTFVGVLAHDDSQVFLEDVSLHQNSTGAALVGAARLRMLRCHIQGNRECGINVMMAGEAEVCRSHFEDNHTAVSLCAQARADVQENHICHNRLGVHLSEKSRVNLWGNRFHQNEFQDVDLKDEARVSCTQKILKNFMANVLQGASKSVMLSKIPEEK